VNDSMKKPPAGWLHVFVRDYQWIHLGLGLIGNLAFVVGSVFFLWPSTKQPALWLFIVGSCGMLVGSIGSAIVKYEHSRNQPSAGQ
jgi:hypothetical protein